MGACVDKQCCGRDEQEQEEAVYEENGVVWVGMGKRLEMKDLRKKFVKGEYLNNERNQSKLEGVHFRYRAGKTLDTIREEEESERIRRAYMNSG